MESPRVPHRSSPNRALAEDQMANVFSQFEIEFDVGADPIFHGGELITGKLKIELVKPVTIKAIKLQFKGRACILNRAEKDGEIEKVYFDRDFILLERPPGHLEPGHFLWNANFVYSLPFECPFPKGCPSSYESPSAFVRYFARATFEIDGAESNKYMVKRGITVVSPPEADALITPPTAEPVSASDTVMFGGCCCRGKVTAEVSLPKRNFAPGDAVVGALKVSNQHPRHVIDAIEVRLLDRVSVASADLSAPASARILLHRRLEKTDVVKTKSSLSKSDVFFFEVPAVLPSPAGAQPVTQSPEIYSMAPDTAPSKVVESPSTATLKFRKQPFLRVDYVIQVSIGTHITLELPIVILSTPVSGSSVEYRPFVAGAQPFGDSDEADKKRLAEAEFAFAPLYPVLIAPKPLAATVVNGGGVPQTPCNTVNGGTPAANESSAEVAAGALKAALMHEGAKEDSEEEDAHRMEEMKEELERLADEVKGEIQKVQKEAEEEVAKAAKTAKETRPVQVVEELAETVQNGDVVVHRQVEVKKTEGEDGEVVTTTTTTEIRHETHVSSPEDDVQN
ncbi:hypothetical protein QR680_017197 [Steinernema hermaphroditum]|uniref:Arrestin C-terminal-like domain-containing protein n=1 Tax=Steinernema hermaphroditum TaxID=289476 RepID=A0AA39LNP7_9BILA|nr:hypothetical protein QR680_017197 [Steinernema hermaphroditum]